MNLNNSFSFQSINWILSVVVCTLLLSACGDTTEIGSELFDGEELTVTTTDTLTIRAKTTQLDSIRVFNAANTTINTFLLGQLEDPFFGDMTASLISAVYLGSDIGARTYTLPNYQEDDVLDSMVLVLAIDTLGFYGELNSRFDFKVFRLTESINSLIEIYSNEEINFDPSMIGFADNVSIPTDSSAVYFPSRGTTVNEFPQIRIPLNEETRNELFNDLGQVASDTAFVNAFNGIRVEATPVSGSSMIGINISSNSINSKIQSFYSRGDTTLLYEYGLNNLSRGLSEGRKYTDFQRDYSGSSIEEFVNGESDSLLFLQSMLGTSLELDLASIHNLEDVLINQAILELTIANPGSDDLDVYKPVDNVIISYLDENGLSRVLEEINEGLAFNQLDLNFGGGLIEAVVNGENVFQYKMNITRSLIEMIDGDVPTRIFITPFQITERANRSILYGPGHSEFPMRLSLSVTSL